MYYFYFHNQAQIRTYQQGLIQCRQLQQIVLQMTRQQLQQQHQRQQQQHQPQPQQLQQEAGGQTSPVATAAPVVTPPTTTATEPARVRIEQ